MRLKALLFVEHRLRFLYSQAKGLITHRVQSGTRFRGKSEMHLSFCQSLAVFPILGMNLLDIFE